MKKNDKLQVIGEVDMENKFIRSKFNGLTKEVYDWDFISISPFFKEEFRTKTGEKEIIDAYLHSAECL